MTIRHHPSDETLLRYAARTLEAGPSIVVATHLAGCPACRARVAQFEAVGGALIEALPPTALAPDALARALAVIDGPTVAAPPAPPSPRQAVILPAGIALPEPLRACEIGGWRWMGPGMHWSRVSVPGDPRANLMLLRVGPGRKLPEHGHTGTEWTQVISGSFSDVNGIYGPGDLSEADSEVDHQPVVSPDGVCICLVAMEGQMQLHGLLGRMLQPFLRA